MIDLYLFDKNKEVIGIVPSKDLISYDQTQELNNLITASFETVYSEKLEEALYFGSKDIEDESIFWRYKIVNFSKNSNTKTFSVEGIFELFDDLKNRKIFKDIRPRNKSAEYALNMLLEGTTWKVGKINSNHTATSTWYYETALDAFRDFIKKWRVEFKPRITFKDGKVVDKFIDIENQISDNYGKWYEYGDKLLKVTAESNNADIATAFYIRGKGEEHTNEDGEVTGYGRRITIADVEWKKSKGDPENKPKGQEFIVLEEATKLYGFEDGSPRFDVIILEDIEDKQELIKAGYQEALRLSRPQRQFKATITEDEFAELGEISTIIDSRLNIRYQTRTFKIKRDFLNSKIKEIEFGDRLVKSRSETITDIADKKVQENSVKTDNKISNLRTELISKQEEIAKSKLQEIRDDLISKYWSSTAYTYNLQPDNEYKLPAGIYSFNAPIDKNPTRAIYLGGGLLMISNSKKSDGNWNWTTVADGAGVNASAINAGTIDANLINVINLKADNITTGKLQGSNANWDLNTGLWENGSKYGSRVTIKDGVLQTWDGSTRFASLDGDGIDFYNGYNRIGEIGLSKWNYSDAQNLRFGHTDNTSMTISYYENNNFYPYITFDKYKKSGTLRLPEWYPVQVNENALFKQDIRAMGVVRLENDMGIQGRYLDGISTVLIGDNYQGDGIGVDANGEIYRVKDNVWKRIPEIQTAQVTMTGIAPGTTGTARFSFPFKFNRNPNVVVSVNNGSPELFPVGTSNINTSGFTLHIKNNWSKTNDITVNYIAMEG